MSDDALGAGMVDVAHRAVEHAQGEPPKPHGDPLAAVVPTGEAPKQAPQRPVEAVGETSEGDHRGQIGPRPALTITEAARAADVDRRTIRRRLDNGDLPNAYREDDGEGPWRIPIGDLLAAGLHLHAPDAAPPPPDDSDGPARGPAPPPPAFSELAEWRRRAEVAEALAAERERTIRALELALRALGPGPPTTTEASAGSPPAPAPSPPSQPEPAPRSSWWRRRGR